MPIVNVPSDSLRIHSWLAVYLRLVGTFIAVLLDSREQALTVAHERWFHNASGKRLTADFHLHPFARDYTGGQPRKRNRCAERRRKCSAGDFALAGSGHHLLMGAQ